MIPPTHPRATDCVSAATLATGRRARKTSPQTCATSQPGRAGQGCAHGGLSAGPLCTAGQRRGGHRLGVSRASQPGRAGQGCAHGGLSAGPLCTAGQRRGGHTGGRATGRRRWCTHVPSALGEADQETELPVAVRPPAHHGAGVSLQGPSVGWAACVSAPRCACGVECILAAATRGMRSCATTRINPSPGVASRPCARVYPRVPVATGSRRARRVCL